MQTKTEQRHKRTIAEELHAQWRKLERKGDAEAIATVLHVSKPTIDKALIYGCVHQQKIVDGITKYMADRIIREKDSAAHLNELDTKSTIQPA